MRMLFRRIILHHVHWTVKQSLCGKALAFVSPIICLGLHSLRLLGYLIQTLLTQYDLVYVRIVKL